MKFLNLALGLSVFLSIPCSAQILARFSCQRPEPVEEGSATNAGIACTLVDATVLKPGEIFSFNRHMTPGLNRFVEGTAYANGKVIKSEGGGVCQVSAALYNAALLAGLQVTERYSHSVYDSATAYVPAGRDCAISRGSGADFRFLNSTAAPLSMSVKALGGKVEVILFGQQRNPKRRWIVTQELARKPHRTNVVMDDNLAPGFRNMVQKGFDGLRLRRQLCKAGAQGLTQCVALGDDNYLMMNEILKLGPQISQLEKVPSPTVTSTVIGEGNP